MPKRTKESLLNYKKCCKKVWERASGVCEILIEGERCKKYIPFEECKYINFLHKETRSGKTQEWVSDPDNIYFGCASHHIDEEMEGVRVQGVDYDDSDNIVYVPDEN